MNLTSFQTPQLRDSNDNIIQQGAFGKNTAFSNAQNTGWIDYVMNDLQALQNDKANSSDLNSYATTAFVNSACLTPTVVNVTKIASSITSVEDAKYFQVGKVVVVFCTFNTGTVSSVTERWFSGFPKPKAHIRLTGVNSNLLKSFRFDIDSNGQLGNAYTNASDLNNSTIQLSGVYITE